MKNLLAVLLLLMLTAVPAYAESAREYAAYLESALKNAAYQDAQAPDFVQENLGADYDIAARTDAHYGSYIACSRKDSAPQLPEGVHQEGYFSGESGIFRLVDGKGKVCYEFVLRPGVDVRQFDDGRHIIITIDENSGAYNPFSQSGNMIYHAADPERRSRLAYAEKKGFSMEGGNILVNIHNKESWHAGATREPIAFYMDFDAPETLFGDRYLEKEMFTDYARIPIGIYYQNGEAYCEFVISEGGVYGVEDWEEGRLYSAGPGFQVLLNEIESMLGYRPGNLDFIGKTPVRASFEWQAGETQADKGNGYEICRWNAGAVSIDDALALKKLDELIKTADFTIGSVNCPSPAFMTVEYSDGSCASFAVAINSFDLFFRNGVLFTTDEDILDLFSIRETEFYKGMFGE